MTAKLRALGAEIEKVSSEKEIQKFRIAGWAETCRTEKLRL